MDVHYSSLSFSSLEAAFTFHCLQTLPSQKKREKSKQRAPNCGLIILRALFRIKDGETRNGRKTASIEPSIVHQPIGASTAIEARAWCRGTGRGGPGPLFGDGDRPDMDVLDRVRAPADGPPNCGACGTNRQVYSHRMYRYPSNTMKRKESCVVPETFPCAHGGEVRCVVPPRLLCTPLGASTCVMNDFTAEGVTCNECPAPCNAIGLNGPLRLPLQGGGRRLGG